MHEGPRTVNHPSASEPQRYFRAFPISVRVCAKAPKELRSAIADALTLQRVALETDSSSSCGMRAVVRDIRGSICPLYSDETSLKILYGAANVNYVSNASAELFLDWLIHKLILRRELESQAFMQEARRQLLVPLEYAPTVTHTVVGGKLYQRDMVDALQLLVAVMGPDTSVKLKELHAGRDRESYFHSAYWKIVRFNLLAENRICAMSGCQNRAEQLHFQDYSCVGFEYKEIYQAQSRKLAHVCYDCHSKIHLGPRKNFPSTRDGDEFERFHARAKFLQLAKAVLEEYVCC